MKRGGIATKSASRFGDVPNMGNGKEIGERKRNHPASAKELANGQ